MGCLVSERSGFDAWVREQLSAVEDCLSRWVSADAPAGLGEAMRYGVLDGGKWLRPLLALAAAHNAGAALLLVILVVINYVSFHGLAPHRGTQAPTP